MKNRNGIISKCCRTVYSAKRGLILSLLVSLASVCWVTSDEVCSTCIKVNGICFNITYLFDLDAPFRNTIVIREMGILRSSNILYYSFEPKITDYEYYKVGFVDLDDRNVTGVLSNKKMNFNFGTFDIDQNNNKIYLGGSDGIYELDTSKHLLALYSSRGDTIVSVFFKGNIYFIRYGENKIIRKKGDFFDLFLDYGTIKDFVITNSGVIVFRSSDGLFASKNNETVRLSKNAFFRGLTIDLDDSVYAWWIDGIYKVVIENVFKESTVAKIVHIPTMGAMTFDNSNNILFTSNKGLYRLTNANTTKC